MAQTTQHNQIPQPEEKDAVDLGTLFHDFFRGGIKYWWVVLILVVVFAAVQFVRSTRSYRPMYRSEASFTVATRDSGDENYYYSFYYDKVTATQMANTFPHLLDSDLLLDMVKEDLGVSYLNGTPRASVVNNSNLFTLSVVSSDPEDAYNILQAVIDNYPDMARFVIGDIQLNMIDAPKIPTTPYNSMGRVDAAIKGAMLGLILGCGFLLLYAVTRNTVRKDDTIKEKLNTQCVGVVPRVIFKKRSGKVDRSLSVLNDKTGDAFQENFRSIVLRSTGMMNEKNQQVLMVTSTQVGEGVTTVSRNIATILGEMGKRVLLLDANFSKGGSSSNVGLEQYLAGELELSQVLVYERKQRYWSLGCSRRMGPRETLSYNERLHELIGACKQVMDYVIIDSPACENTGDAAMALELAEAVLYIIKQDHTKIGRIMDSIEDLGRYEATLLGCVMNDAQGGLTGYGYDYSKYGRYGHYGYYGNISNETKS